MKIWISRSFFSLEFECISSSSWQSFFGCKALVGNHFLRYRTLVGNLFSKIVSSSWQFFFKIRSFSWQSFSMIKSFSRQSFSETLKSCRPSTKWIMLREFTFRGHPHKISNFLGPFLTYLPTHIQFPPNSKPFLPMLHRLYLFFINLPTCPKIRNHMCMTPYICIMYDQLHTINPVLRVYL